MHRLFFAMHYIVRHQCAPLLAQMLHNGSAVIAQRRLCICPYLVTQSESETCNCLASVS